MSQANPSKLRKALKRQWLYVSIAVGITLFGFVLFSNRGIVQRISLENKKRKMQTEILQSKYQRDSLQRNIEKLHSDTLLIEQIAREKYGMIKQGETVFIVE